jgi:hypothetical protein
VLNNSSIKKNEGEDIGIHVFLKVRIVNSIVVF